MVLLLLLLLQRPTCDPALWQRVYKPNRLKIIKPCATVHGVIVAIKKQPDGDLHILVRPDKRYLRLLNAVNISAQKGALVVEPICEGPISQNSVGHICDGYQSALAIPKPLTHVSVTGPLVLDTQHGWVEIHPLNSIRRL